METPSAGKITLHVKGDISSFAATQVYRMETIKTYDDFVIAIQDSVDAYFYDGDIKCILQPQSGEILKTLYAYSTSSLSARERKQVNFNCIIYITLTDAGTGLESSNNFIGMIESVLSEVISKFEILCSQYHIECVLGGTGAILDDVPFEDVCNLFL